MKKTGVWIDKDKAHLITLNDEREEFKTIDSDIEFFHVTANKTLGGTKEIVKDRKFLEREKHQTKAYLKNIIAELSEAQAIVIFGPAQMRKKLKKELDENHSNISVKVKGVEKANKMTDNQIKAWVRDFFK